MTDSTAGAATMAGPRMGSRQRTVPSRPHDAWLYLLLALLVALTWLISRMDWFTAASDAGYWIGVAGGLCMLLLFTYPMRKHLRFMQRFGSGKPWFVAHMVFGVGGPLLILVHSTYRIGSINAGVALFSMLIVAASGVVGRFLYVRLHRNLRGEKMSLIELRGQREAADGSVSRLRFAPDVAARILAYEREALPDGQAAPGLWQALVHLPVRRWQVRHECRRELKLRILALGRSEGFSRGKTRRALEEARRLVGDELMTIQRIAQFSAWERLFSWWHVAHVPFVYLMLLSAVAHVVAVHAY